MSRKLWVVAATALCAAVLAACGGGDFDDGRQLERPDQGRNDRSAPAPAPAPARKVARAASRAARASRAKGARRKSRRHRTAAADRRRRLERRRLERRRLGGGGSGAGGSSFSGPPTKHKHPQPVEGKRSDGFVVKGGDNSIQEYGDEQDAAARAEATRPIAALYRATDQRRLDGRLQHLPLGRQRRTAGTVRQTEPEAEGQGLRRDPLRLNQSSRQVSRHARRRCRRLPDRRRHGLCDLLGDRRQRLCLRPEIGRRALEAHRPGADAAHRLLGPAPKLRRHAAAARSPIHTTCSRSGPTPTSLIGTPANSEM